MTHEPSILALFPEAGAIPSRYDIAAPLHLRTYLVDGELLPWQGEVQDVVSPISLRTGDTLTPRVIGSCPMLDEAAALAAVEAVCKAWNNGTGQWPTMTVAERIRHIEDFTLRMVEKREDIIRLLMWEIGKPLLECSVEFDRTVDYIRDTVDAMKDLDRASSRFVIEKGIYAQIRRAPLGPVLCMGPFNYPLNETFATLIPALIMGNPAIVKTPKMGRLFFAPMLEAFRECFPAGVINVLFGDRRVAKPIMASGRINVLAFIGTSNAADILRLAHPQPHRLRCILGMDAKNAAIILDSADMDTVIGEVLNGSLAFSGQRCTALKIIFVQRSRVDAFLQRFNEAIPTLPLGMPWDDGVRITPLPVPGKVEYLDSLVADAISHGAQVVNKGGATHAGPLYHPTVLYPVTPAMRVYHEEQFGPVVPVVPFDDVETPLSYIISSQYGQQLSVFGTDPDAVAHFIDPLVNQVCRVNINSQCQRGPDTFPFTGRKDSAEGTLSVSDALRSFSIRTLVAAKGTDANKALLSGIIRTRKSNFLSTDFLL